MFWFKHANTKKKHISKHSWLSGWVILNILAHLAHLAQSYFSLIFSATNTYNCSQFDLTNKKSCSDWRQKLGEKWTTLTTFFLTATAAITGNILRYLQMHEEDLLGMHGQSPWRFPKFLQVYQSEITSQELHVL